MDKLKLAIIIPTFNRKDYLNRILKDFEKQKNIFFECQIYVVVDGSNDGSLVMLNNDFPLVNIVEGDGNWWWTKSINKGLKLAIDNECTEFLLMNDDTYIKSDFLVNLVKSYLLAGKGIMGAISVTVEEPNKIFYSGIKSVNWLTAKYHKYHQQFSDYNNNVNGVQKTLFIPGRGMLFNLDVINKIGYLREELFPQYFADFDFSYLAYKTNFPININWDTPIYSHVELTGKGSKSNSNFLEFFSSFFNKMSPNSISGNYVFYKSHVNGFYLISLIFHYIRIIAAFIISKLKS